ncbi:MAG: OmpH/Skp family outer membrane protein [Planctomycetota bacterium]|jgi:Skp family chaperone for outer membrane proteins
MKFKALILVCVTVVVVFCSTHNFSFAKSKTVGVQSSSDSGIRIGVISVRKIFTTCKRNQEYKQKVQVEQQQIVAEMTKLQKEIEADEATLKAGIKPDSSDYMNMMRSILEKRGQYEAMKQFYQQQISAKDREWTKKLYLDVMQITEDIAKSKGLGLVVAEDEVDLDNVVGDEFMLRIRMHKVVFSGGCEDLTDEVMAKLDAE